MYLNFYFIYSLIPFLLSIILFYFILLLFILKDINKIVRYDYGDDVLYMKLMMEALPLWQQFNKERLEEGEDKVFHQTGVLLMSRNGQYSDFERKSLKAIRQAGYGHAIEELLTPESIIQRFPQFEKAVRNGFNIAYLNKDGGKVYLNIYIYIKVENEMER